MDVLLELLKMIKTKIIKKIKVDYNLLFKFRIYWYNL